MLLVARLLLRLLLLQMLLVAGLLLRPIWPMLVQMRWGAFRLRHCPGAALAG